MSMKMGVPYSMVSTVIEFEPDHRIGWQAKPSAFFGRFVGGRIWRDEFEEVDGGTRVRESWDITQDKQRSFLKRGKVGEQTPGTLPGRSSAWRSSPKNERARARLSGRSSMPPGSSASCRRWCEYTRIPRLSSAYHPHWAERGAMDAAASTTALWGARPSRRRPTTELVELPGRTPVLLIDNGGSGDPIVVYGHMDKQPPLGERRPRTRLPSSPCARGIGSTTVAPPTTATPLFAAVTGLLGRRRWPRARAPVPDRGAARRVAAPTCWCTSST